MRAHRLVLGILLMGALAPGAWAGAPQGHDRFPTTKAPEALVEIIEVGDFQCPFCARAESTLQQIRKQYGDKVQLTFVHNPLSFHKEAFPAAAAAVAAQLQGKFWEMRDKLFANQRQLADEDLRRYALEVGLDVERFDRDRDADSTTAFIDLNQRLAVGLGATGTPAFFINGKSLRGAQPFERFAEIIEAEIAEARERKRSGAGWIAERTKANNEALHSYVYAGAEPRAAVAREPLQHDKTVYRVSVDPKADPILGDDRALVTLVVFAEYQCPFCARLHPSLMTLVEKYAGKLRLVFKMNPLPFHKRAMPASEAALCALEQGDSVFWRLSDTLFKNQRALEDADLERYAAEAGVFRHKWGECFVSHRTVAKITADQELAGNVTARGTPNSFINGIKLTGAKPIEEFTAVIDEQLAKAEVLAKSTGDRGQALYERITKDGKLFEPLEEKVNAFVIDQDTPVLGDPNAPIRITVFADFQCPFCARVAPVLHEVKKHYGAAVAIIYKHFPLSFHKRALPAAEASVCAHAQGRFWELYDQLWNSQKALEDEDLRSYAAAIGLDMVAYGVCRDSSRGRELIEKNMEEGRNAAVRGTPTIYINGRKFNSPSGYNLDAFTAVIDKHVLQQQ